MKWIPYTLFEEPLTSKFIAHERIFVRLCYYLCHIHAEEVSHRDATLKEFSPGNLIEITHIHMILIGHTGAGKTSVVKHLKDEKIDPDENSTEVMEQRLLFWPKQPKHLI